MSAKKYKPKVSKSRQFCERWGCKIRTVQIMTARGIDLADPAAVVAWFDGLDAPAAGRVKATFREKIEAARAAAGGGQAQLPLAKLDGGLTPAEFAEFESNYSTSRSAQDALKDLRHERAFWLFVLTKAKRRGDEHAINHAGKQFTLYDASLHKAELRALRQGLETGEVLARAEHERIVAAWCFHAMRSIDEALPTLSRKLVGMAEPQDVRAVLEPALLSAAYFEPFAQSVSVSTGNAMPA